MESQRAISIDMLKVVICADSDHKSSSWACNKIKQVFVLFGIVTSRSDVIVL